MRRDSLSPLLTERGVPESVIRETKSLKRQASTRSGRFLRLLGRYLGMFLLDVVRNFGTHLLQRLA